VDIKLYQDVNPLLLHRTVEFLFNAIYAAFNLASSLAIIVYSDQGEDSVCLFSNLEVAFSRQGCQLIPAALDQRAESSHPVIHAAVFNNSDKICYIAADRATAP
jgi:hypothetical protein